MAFIMGSQYKKLREAAKNGDERAKSILKMQLDDDNDSNITNSIDEYFRKVEEPVQVEESMEEEPVTENFDASLINTGNRRLDKFLKDNHIDPNHEDYQEFVDSFYEMFPSDEHEGELETVPEENEIEESNLVENEEELKEETGRIQNAEGTETRVEPEQDISGVLEFLLADENEAIDGYDKAIKAVANLADMDETQKNGIVATFQHIKEEELEHIKELQEIQKSIIIK